MEKSRYSRVLVTMLILVLVMLPSAAYGIKDIPNTGEKQNVKLVGYSDLQGRETLQVTVKGDYCYVGHHPGQHINPLTGENEFNGTTILDISDPKNPEILSHISCDIRTNCRSVSVVDDYMGTGKDYLIRNFENSEVDKYEIWDITDKRNPVHVSDITEENGVPFNFCHKGFWSEESGLFYSASSSGEFRDGGHLVIHDLTDPYNPKYVSSWWLPGQKLDEPDPGHPLNFHHPIVDEARHRVYGAYLSGGNVVSVDVSDPYNPTLKWHIDTEPPGRDAHTAAVIEYDSVPNFGEKGLPRLYCLVSDEATGGDMAQFENGKLSGPPREPARCKLYMFDVTNADETGVPFPVETWQVPDGDYLLKGARFGPHQFNETIDGEYNTFDDKIAWVAYFNAGVRVIDISDPYNIKEIGHYVPEATERSLPVSSGQPSNVIQINDVDLDSRGLAYCSDRVGNGLFILQYTKKIK